MSYYFDNMRRKETVVGREKLSFQDVIVLSLRQSKNVCYYCKTLNEISLVNKKVDSFYLVLGEEVEYVNQINFYLPKDSELRIN